jgi:SAM-dependent methyltransferase
MSIENRYYGNEADSYDAKRRYTRTHQAEDKAFDALFARLMKKPVRSVLDVPSGTGRWIERLTSAGLDYTGVDVSADMLRHSQSVVNRANARNARLQEADCFRYLPDHPKQFDLVVSTRFINWWDEDTGLRLITLLCGASRQFALFHVRLYDTAIQRAVSVALRLPNRVRKAIKDRDHLAREVRNFGRSGKHPYISYHNRARVKDALSAAGFGLVQSVVLRRHSYGTVEFWLASRKPEGAPDAK